MTVKPAISNGLKIYEIHSRELEPSTDYVVSVKSDLNNIFSESSDEMEFTTRKFIIIIVLINVLVAVIIFNYY